MPDVTLVKLGHYVVKRLIHNKYVYFTPQDDYNHVSDVNIASDLQNTTFPVL